MSSGFGDLVRYFANPCGQKVIDAMIAGHLGLIDQPNQNKVTPIDQAHAGDVPWCADNGAFSDRFDEARWWKFLIDNAHRASTCIFAVAPDVVGDATATMERSGPWLAKIRGLGYPVALVAQDGWEDLPDIPWDEFDCLFIGGTTGWKLGPYARQAVRDAKGQGKWVHMGRVNSQRRWLYADAIGCDSVDGTFLTFGPEVNLPKLLAWVRNNDQDSLFGGVA